LLLNLQTTELEIVTVVVQQLEDIFSMCIQFYAPGLIYWIWGQMTKCGML
jgi:hypothetical protein